MDLHPPDEIMVEKLLPAMRHLVSRRLSAEGYSQGRISSMLGITQASVSHYLASRSDRTYAILAELSLSKDEADRCASLLAEDAKRNPLDSVDTLSTLWVGMLGKGLVCPLHRKMYPVLAQCDICVRQFGPGGKEPSEVVEQVASAIRAIEKSPTFVNVMPEVSVNIVALEGDSDSPEDVVAIPGRIVRVRNQARAMSPPERGASRHMARMLLLVRKRVPGTRAALNLKYDGRMAMALKRLGLKSITIGDYGSSGSEDPTVEALASKLLLSAETFDVVVDSGGRGIEPSVYLFGGSAPEAAAMAVRIADLYSAG